MIMNFIIAFSGSSLRSFPSWALRPSKSLRAAGPDGAHDPEPRRSERGRRSGGRAGEAALPAAARVPGFALTFLNFKASNSIDISECWKYR